MDLEQLNKIDTSNPAQVKALQQFLKTRGYYNGPIDGKWGGGTTEGAVKLRTDLTNTANTRRDTAIAEQEANDPTNNAIRGATEIGPYVAGMATGATVGHLGARALKGKDTAQRASVKAIAADPRITPNAAQSQLRGMRVARNATTGAQFGAPALFLGSAEYLRRDIAPRFEKDGKDTETSKWIKLGANLDQGVGLGVLGHQLVGLKDRIPSPNDPVDEALIASRAAPTPPPSGGPPPTLRTPADRLTAAARVAGATGKQAATKASAASFLAKNVTDANRVAVATELGVEPGGKVPAKIKSLLTSRKPSMIVGPMIAAGMAYDAALSDAEAAGATPGEARTRGAAAGTGAAALTGAASYGLSKLPAALGGALSVGSSALTPFMAADAYDPTPERLATDRNLAARIFPAAVRGAMPAVAEAYEAAQVPEASPRRNLLAGQVPPDRLPTSARTLHVPEGIPLPQPDGASPYAEAQPARAAAGDERFNAALNEWLSVLTEHSNSLREGPPLPSRGNFPQAPTLIGAR